MGLDEIGRLLAKCPPAAFVPHPPDTRAIEKRCATEMGLDPATVEAWLAERGGEVRETEVRTSRGLRPGRVLSPPPRTTTVYYIVPNAALARGFGESPTPIPPRVTGQPSGGKRRGGSWSRPAA